MKRLMYRLACWWLDSPRVHRMRQWLYRKTSATQYGNLLELLGENIPYEEAGYGSYDRKESTGNKNYLDWEREIAEPRLQKLGYEVYEWKTGERDSWGPLSRIVVTDRGSFIYG